MDQLTKCPCENCPVIPICRHKNYNRLHRECSILMKYQPHYHDVFNRKQNRVARLHNTLKPTMWYTHIGSKSGRVYVAHRSKNDSM